MKQRYVGELEACAAGAQSRCIKLKLNSEKLPGVGDAPDVNSEGRVGASFWRENCPGKGAEV